MQETADRVGAQSRRLIDAAGLIVVVPVCGALILVHVLAWSLMDSLTPLGYGPILLGLWALWLLVGIGALVTYLVRRPRRLGSALPVLVCVATFVILKVMPFNEIQARIDLRAHRVEREAVVAHVLSGELEADEQGLVSLGLEGSLSRGGTRWWSQRLAAIPTSCSTPFVASLATTRASFGPRPAPTPASLRISVKLILARSQGTMTTGIGSSIGSGRHPSPGLQGEADATRKRS